jgi:hypothetical protein
MKTIIKVFNVSNYQLKRALKIQHAAKDADSYERHFGTSSLDLTDVSRASVEKGAWQTSRTQLGKLGQVIYASPEGVSTSSSESHSNVCLIVALYILPALTCI